MDRPGYIYIIKADTGHYKIGRSKNVPGRMKLFTVNLPFKFEIINHFPCEDMTETEKDLHGIYYNKRVNGEWFSLLEEDVRFLEAIGFARRFIATDYPAPPDWILEHCKGQQWFYHRDGQLITQDYPTLPWWALEEYLADPLS